MNDHREKIKADRQLVYGNPRQNHIGIAQMWAPLLQPHWLPIRNGNPLPEHVVALLMAALKLDRMRLRYHSDNYDDAINYLEFAREWQAESVPPRTEDGRLRIFVAGPYSAEKIEDRLNNVCNAAKVGLALIKKGHLVYVPHTMSHYWHGALPYEAFMDQTLPIIREWATALFYVGSSPGADRECFLAKQLGLPVFSTLESVPGAADPPDESPTPHFRIVLDSHD